MATIIPRPWHQGKGAGWQKALISSVFMAALDTQCGDDGGLGLAFFAPAKPG